MYRLTIFEIATSICCWLIISICFSYLFYESFVVCIMFTLGYPFFLKRRKIKLIEGKKNHIRKEFGDLCVAIDNCLKSGYSLENAYCNGVNEIKKIYGDKSLILQEAVVVINKMKMNIPIEVAINEFANNTKVQEIIIFSEMIQIAKRSSGNISEIISKTVKNIQDIIDYKRQVSMIFASKKYEQMIMNVMPLLIIVYAKFSATDSIKIMYETVIGRVIMTGCLLMYVAALVISEKIMETCKC